MILYDNVLPFKSVVLNLLKNVTSLRANRFSQRSPYEKSIIEDETNIRGRGKWSKYSESRDLKLKEHQMYPNWQ